MSQYLAPGVYVEEVSFRSKSIEGVPTSTTGFAGMARFGPVQYPGGPTTTEPRLITSFTEFERVYGGLEPIGPTQRVNYLAHAARAYFLNGGKRLYISRVIAGDGSAAAASGAARAVGAGTARWRARWPGSFGNVQVETRLNRTRNVNFTHPPSDPVRSAWGAQARGARAGTVVEITPAGGGLATVLSRVGPFALDPGDTLEVSIDGAADVAFVFNATRAVKPGAGADFGNVADGDTLVLRIDDGEEQTITFEAGDTTADLVAARINEGLVGGAAVVNGAEVDILSDRFGSGSTVEVLAGSTAAVAIGHSVTAAGVVGNNVADIDAVTADEVVALLGPLAGAVVTNENGAVRVTSLSAGAGSGVVVRPGAAATALQFVSPAVHAGSALSGAGPFDLADLQTLLVLIDSPDPADAQTFTFEATRASKPGVAGDFASMSDGLTLVVRIDGGPEQTIPFTAADTTAAAVAARINSVLVGGAAVVTGGQVQLRSDRQGTTSRVEVLPASTAQDETGQQAGAAIGTGNVGNIDAVTAGEVVALLEDLDGGTAAAEGDRVRITSGTRGGTSTVQVLATSTAAGLGFDNAVHGPGGKLPTGNDVPNLGQLFVVELDPDGRQRFVNRTTPLPGLAPSPDDTLSILTLSVLVNVDGERVDGYDALGAHPDDRRYAGRILDAEDPEDENAVVWLDVDDAAALESAELLLAALRGSGPTGHAEVLSGGADGGIISPDDLLGREADPDNPDLKATGLEALGEYDDIAIVAAPDAATLSHPVVAAGYLIAHAERQRYRIAVVDGPPGASITQIRQFRGQFDSKYAALYYPWIQVLDPTERAAQGAPPRKLLLPASGFVAGIYARSDVERGVHKAPANEVVRGLTQFELNINRPRNDVLNPEGINALRFLEGRGNRVWGARTMSSDPEWRYVNVRRLFIYLEHSIDKGTQWAVFEPNNRRLWDNIRQTVEDFLLVMWRDGALLGDKPEDAYFVRCDRTTMTQNDLDNGRLICLVGVAPVKPAEFVIFRVGQWTAESKV